MKRKLSKKQQKWEDTVKDYATALFIIRHGCTPTDDNPRIPDSAIQSAVLSAATKQIRLSGLETRRLK